MAGSVGGPGPGVSEGTDAGGVGAPGVSKVTDTSLSMRLLISSMKLKWPRVRSVGTAQLHQLLTDSASQIVLLDARPEEEYAVSHIAHARRVDADSADVEHVFKEISAGYAGDIAGAAPVTVVCYCSVGYRSSQYAHALQKHISTEKLGDRFSVYNLEGSLFKWANEGRPMVDAASASTTRCHPYSGLWGKLLKPGLAYQPAKTQ